MDKICEPGEIIEAMNYDRQPDDDPRQYDGESLPSEEDVKAEQSADNESESNRCTG